MAIRIFILILFLIPRISFAKEEAPQPIPKNLSQKMAASVQEAGEGLLTQECDFLVQLYNKKDVEAPQLGLCFYTHREVRGIFAAVACVGVIIESDSLVKNAFYGKDGHWGIEGECDGMKLIKKMKEKTTMETVNPISSVALKRLEGIQIRLLKDKLSAWTEFETVTRPEKKK